MLQDNVKCATFLLLIFIRNKIIMKKVFWNLLLKLTAENQDFYDLFFVFALLFFILGEAVVLYGPVKVGLLIFCVAIFCVLVGLLGRVDRRKIKKKLEDC